MARVNSENHATAETLFKSGKTTPQVQQALQKEGLIKSQANDCCRTARKHLGIYKGLSKQAKENAVRAKREAEEQVNKKTEVTED
jgi:hypothetical protein